MLDQRNDVSPLEICDEITVERRAREAREAMSRTGDRPGYEIADFPETAEAVLARKLILDDDGAVLISTPDGMWRLEL